MRKAILRSALVFAILLPGFAAGSAHAQHGGGCACGRFVSAQPTWEIDHAAPFHNAAITEFTKWRNVVNRWNWTTGDNLAGVNGKNEILFFTAAQASAIYGVSVDEFVFGFAFLSPQSAFGTPSFNGCPPPPGVTCGTFTETDVVMNADFYRGWTTSLPNYNDTGPANYGATALHELGHALGMHHNFSNLSTMNYFEDFATIYLSIADSAIARVHYPSNIQSTIDMGTYPFRYTGAGDGYSSTIVASPSPSTVAAGQAFTLRDFTVENPGSATLSNVVLSVYLSTDTTITTGDILVGTLTWSSFATNGWWDTSGQAFTVPAGTPQGTYYIGARVSYNTSASDGVTYNNSWVLDSSRRLTVGASGGGCVQDFQLTCGSSDSWFNNGAGSTNAVSSYACFPANPLTGPEYTYVFDAPADTHVQLDLTGLSADLDMIVLRDVGGGCQPGSCISGSAFSGTAPEFIDFSAVAGHRYYVVVDGFLGSTSGYDIQLNCDGPTFADVPSGYWAFNQVQALYNAGITTGCASGPRRYCPDATVSRDQMAVFLERAIHGRYFSPPGALGIFSDVPDGYWAENWIEALYNDGITTGCASSPLRYCPTANVTRAEMAVFLLRAKHGPSYTPPPAVGIFSDVPVGYWAAPWIERLYNEGITGGCASSPLRYCPGNNVIRSEMAVFLQRTFNLPLP